jgi:hypothetical protein
MASGRPTQHCWGPGDRLPGRLRRWTDYCQHDGVVGGLRLTRAAQLVVPLIGVVVGLATFAIVRGSPGYSMAGASSPLVALELAAGLLLLCAATVAVRRPARWLFGFVVWLASVGAQLDVDGNSYRSSNVRIRLLEAQPDGQVWEINGTGVTWELS